jgi:SnoaL-like domain
MIHHWGIAILNGVLAAAVLVVMVGMHLVAIALGPGEDIAPTFESPRESRLRLGGGLERVLEPRGSRRLRALSERLEVLEAEEEIGRLMAAYVRARDFGEDAVADYFTADAVWEGVGDLAALLGRHEGQAAIAERFAAATPPAVHLLANQSIQVHRDHALGTWTFLQPTVFDERAIWLVARYHNDFQLSAGRWLLRHVRIEAIFQAAYEDGWAREAFFLDPAPIERT